MPTPFIKTAPMHVTPHDVREFDRWRASLDYRAIRQAESALSTNFSNGRRVRGVLITPDICVARDGLFYDISGHDKAVILDPRTLLARYSLDTIKTMFDNAVLAASNRA